MEFFYQYTRHFVRPTHWVHFIQRLRLLETNSSALRNSNALTPEALHQLTSDAPTVMSQEYKTTSLQKFHAVMAFGSLSSSAGPCQGASHSALWLPLDLLLEDVMDGCLVNATSAIEIISGEARFCSKFFTYNFN